LVESSEIIAQAKAGDPQAFQALVRPHIDKIRRFARSFCKDPTDADDLAQEAFVKAFLSFASFDGRSSLVTWLYSVAKNQFLDYRRSKLFQWRARETQLVDNDSSQLPNSEQLLSERQQTEALWVALRRIGEKFRTPLVLAEIEGLRYEEIADIEGIPVGTVRSRIARGKDQLRAMLGVVDTEHSRGPSGTVAASATSNPLTKGVR